MYSMGTHTVQEGILVAKNGKNGERLVTRVAVYLRVSTDEQRRSGLGIAAQRDRCEGMSKAKGWPLPVVYADEGKSGTIENLKRDGLKALIEDAQAGKVDAVIVNDISRLARKVRFVLEFVDTMAKRGVVFVSCKESFDTTTPQGQFVLTLFAALAQLERDLIAARTSDALDVLSRTTGYTGGRVPYGYALAPDNRVVIDREAAQIVRSIFTWHHKGKSLRAIAKHLNDVGALVPRGGESWQHTSVASILSREAVYRGGQRGQSEHRWPVVLTGRKG